MASKFQVEGRITAVDEASVVIERVSRNMEQFGTRARSSQETFARATREGTQTIRAMSIGLLSELNPALGQSVNQFSSATREAARLSPTLGAVTVGAAATAIAISNLVQITQRQSETFARMAQAAHSVDLGAMRSQAKELDLIMRQLQQATERGGLMGFFEQMIIGLKNLGRDLAGEQAQLTKDIEAAQPFERIRIMNEALLKQVEAMRQLRTAESDLAKERLNLEDFETAERRLVALLIQQLDAENKLLTLRRDLALRQPGLRSEERETILLEFNRQQEALTARSAAGFEALAQRGRAGGMAIQAGLNPATAAERLAQAEIQANAQAEAGIEAGRQGMIAQSEKRLELAQQLAATQRDAAGLTEAERANVEIQVIQLEQVLKLEQARRGVGSEQLANLEAQVKIQAIKQRELERTTLAGGFEKATREIGDDWTSLGRRMEDTMRGTASNIQDFLTRSLSGQESGATFGRDFGKAMLTTLAGEVSRFFTGTLFSQLRTGLNTILPGGAGAGNFSQPINATGLPGSQIAALTQQGYQAVQGPAGQTFLIPPSAVMPGNVAGVQSPEFTQTGNLGFQPAAGFNYGGAAVAGVGVGLAAYSAYQFYESTSRGAGGAGATSRGAFAGGLGGLASGLAIGAAAGSLFSPAGTIVGAVIGAVIGLVAGGSLGGVAGSEAEGRGNVAHRREQRLRQAREILQGISIQLDRQDLPGALGGTDFILRQSVDPSGWAMGYILAGLAAEVGGHPIAGYLAAKGYGPRGYNYERINNDRELMLSAGGPQAVGPILDAALQRLQGIDQRATAIEEATGFSYTEQLLGGITRQTLIPLSGLDDYRTQIRQAGVGVQWSPSAARTRGVSDTEIAYLTARMRQYLGDVDAQELTETAWLRLVAV